MLRRSRATNRRARKLERSMVTVRVEGTLMGIISSSDSSGLLAVQDGVNAVVGVGLQSLANILRRGGVSSDLIKTAFMPTFALTKSRIFFSIRSIDL